MLVTHTFVDKSNTIIEDSLANTSLNPILSLYYGNLHSRALIHFDTEKLKGMVEEKVYPDVSKLHHVLKFWNVSDIDIPRIHCRFPDSNITGRRERATSFELILFTIPEDWDAGRGFDFNDDAPINGHAAYSEYGSNWYYRTTDHKWRKPGIYTIEELEGEYENPDSRIIIGRQRFDFGNEQFEMDITDAINRILTGDIENHGFGIAFAPQFEMMADEISQYAGFFSNRTNTFFEPYLETCYDDLIKDDRLNFFLDKPNRLYFYANVGGKYINLDEMPTCTINGSEMSVKQATKGMYYTDITLSSDEVDPNTMIYDTWGNIKYQGRQFPDTELYTTTKASSGYMTLGLPFDTEKHPKFTPSLSGINDNEDIKPGERRKVTVECKINYTTDQTYPLDSLQYRVYVITADRQVDVIEWTECDFIYDANCFYIDTDELIPHKYYVDIKVKYDMEEIINERMLTFNVVNNGRHPE